MSLHPLLRPMGYGELLDEAIDLYRDNFAVLFGIAALVYVPYAIIGYLLPQPKPFSPDPQTLTWLWFPFAASIVVQVGTGAATIAVSQRYLGQPASVGSAYRALLQRGGRFFGMVMAKMFVLGVLTGGWLLATSLTFVLMLLVLNIHMVAAVLVTVLVGLFCVVPVILMMLVLSFSEETVLLEDNSVWESLARSHALARGHFTRILAFNSLVAMLVVMIVNVPIYIAMALLQDPQLLRIFIWVYNGASLSLFMPLQMVSIVLLYYDLRIRKEGFDLELLSQALAQRS